MPNSSRNLVQRAVSRNIIVRGSSKTHHSNDASPKDSERRIYFYVDVFECGENLVPVETLQVGRQYQIILSGDINTRSGVEEMGVIISPLITLHLQSITSTGLQIRVDGEEPMYELSTEEASTFERTIFFTIPSEWPTCDLTLILLYGTPHRRIAYPVATCKIKVIGDYNPKDEQLLEICHIDTELPERAVILAMETEAQQQESYRLRGWSHWGEVLYTKPIPNMNVSLRTLYNKEKETAEEIISEVKRFSEHGPVDLLKWLKALFQKYQQELCLIIVNNTSYEIPWEMIQFGNGQYLGAEVKVVRWIPFRRFTEKCLLQVSETRQRGSVVAYLDSEMGEAETKDERDVLQSIQAELFETLEEWKLRLRQPLIQTALVYIGCHGADGYALYEEKHPLNKLKAINLGIVEMHPEPRPVFFVNACESACFGFDKGGNPDGFVDIFLDRFASGYIGTIGPVGSAEASSIAREIFQAALQMDSIQVAEVLRLLRKEAILRLKAAQDKPRLEREDAEYKFLFTYMYVYYGNPLLHLQLTSGNGMKEE